jgi:hypothetical protein
MLTAVYKYSINKFEQEGLTPVKVVVPVTKSKTQTKEVMFDIPEESEQSLPRATHHEHPIIEEAVSNVVPEAVRTDSPIDSILGITDMHSDANIESNLCENSASPIEDPQLDEPDDNPQPTIITGSIDIPNQDEKTQVEKAVEPLLSGSDNMIPDDDGQEGEVYVMPKESPFGLSERKQSVISTSVFAKLFAAKLEVHLYLIIFWWSCLDSTIVHRVIREGGVYF